MKHVSIVIPRSLLDGGWQDLVCQACNARYEVKTKANMKAVDLEVFFNKISGGSFEAFCSNTIHSSIQGTQVGEGDQGTHKFQIPAN